MIIPHFVDKDAINADRKDLHSKLFKLANFFGNCRNFCCSDEREISWIETKYDPFPKIIRKFY